MSQNRITINGVNIFQPKEDLKYSFTTTYTEDTCRVQTGELHATAMFTVEQLSYEAENIPIAEATKIFRLIAKGTPFTLHYYSIYYGTWRDGQFYVGQGNMNIGTLKENREKLSSLSFNMTGINPI